MREAVDTPLGREAQAPTLTTVPSFLPNNGSCSELPGPPNSLSHAENSPPPSPLQTTSPADTPAWEACHPFFDGSLVGGGWKEEGSPHAEAQGPRLVTSLLLDGTQPSLLLTCILVSPQATGEFLAIL